MVNYSQFAREAEMKSGYEDALIVLEGAHVTYQLRPVIHFKVHWHMFSLALRHKQWREVTGQVPRMILAIPGSIFKLAPKGNIGSTKMGIFQEKKE